MTLPIPVKTPTPVRRTARLLIVDAEPHLTDLLHHAFSRAGHSVTTCDSAGRALRLLKPGRLEAYDLVVVDLVLPDMDGFELIRRIRRQMDTPIMVLSALSRPDDIAQALDLGADGYVCKPVLFTELEAKVQALLRRIYQFDRPDGRLATGRGDIELHSAQRMVTFGERTVRLSATEYRLIQLLLSRPNRPVTKEELLHCVWGFASGEPTNVVELAIARLRRKIEDDPSRPCRLITVRSLGYQLCLPLGGTPRETAEPSLPANPSLCGSVAAGIVVGPRVTSQHPMS